HGTRSNRSTCSPPGTRASHSATPADAEGRTMSDTCGPTSPTPFATYDPAGSCWRTSAATSTSGSAPFSGTWPPSGSMRSGSCYEQPTPAPRTDVPASSSLLPTPSAHESQPTDEYVAEGRAALEDPHRRLYLPGRKWHAQRTLSRI